MNRFILEVNGIRAQVERKKVKYIRMRILPPEGTVLVSMPMRATIRAVREFIEKKQDWIAEKQAQCRRLAQHMPADNDNSDTALMWGRRVALTAEEDAPQDSASLIENGVVLSARGKLTAEKRVELLDRLCREQLLAVLPAVAEKWQQRMNVSAEEWRTRRMKTRWGSCNVDKKRIWINVRLAMLPEECLEYVVVHELCHLFEPSHNRRFKELMDGFMPGCREIGDRMKELGGVLL